MCNKSPRIVEATSILWVEWGVRKSNLAGNGVWGGDEWFPFCFTFWEGWNARETSQ